MNHKSRSNTLDLALNTFIKSGCDLNGAREMAAKRYGTNSAVSKALGGSSFTQGGAILPDTLSQEMIERLTPRSAVRRMNPRVVNLDNGRVSYPKLTAGASANWIGENERIPASEQEFGQVTLTQNKLAALVPVSNDLVMNADMDAMSIITDDMVQVLSTEEDIKYIFGDGTQYSPKGMLNLAAADNVTASNGTSSPNVELDFRELREALHSANIPMENPYYVMSSRSFNYLLNLRDANGNLTFPEVRNAPDGMPRIYNIPVIVSNNIRNDVNGNESEIYCVDAAQLLLGQAGGMEVTMATEGAYTSGNQLCSAFEQDQSLVRAILRVDLNVRHENAIAVKTGVTWGT